MGLSLEAFDTDGAADNDVASPRQTSQFQAGFEAGVEAGLQQAAAQQDALRADVVQSISDMAFGYNEARAHLLKHINPLILITINRLLPATLQSSLGVNLHQMIAEALEIDAAAPAILSVAPDQVAAITLALADMTHPHLTIQSDARLTSHAAIVTACTGETALDLDAALAQISDIYDAIPQSLQRKM